MAHIRKKMKDFWVEVSEFGLGSQAEVWPGPASEVAECVTFVSDFFVPQVFHL